MLRIKYSSPSRKELSVPPLCESVNDVVEVELKDPKTGESLGKHYDQISRVNQLSEESAVAKESADLYSIENMLSVGMTPIICPSGGFIRSGIGSIERVENSAESMLNILPSEENKSE